jgi:hypothetical protein
LVVEKKTDLEISIENLINWSLILSKALFSVQN